MARSGCSGRVQIPDSIARYVQLEFLVATLDRTYISALAFQCTCIHRTCSFQARLYLDLEAERGGGRGRETDCASQFTGARRSLINIGVYVILECPITEHKKKRGETSAHLTAFAVNLNAPVVN